MSSKTRRSPLPLSLLYILRDSVSGAPEFIKQPIIFSVGSDPEPNHLVTFKQTEGTICECYPNGVDWLVVMDFLQVQA